MVTKNAKQLAEEAAKKIAEYAPLYAKIAQAPSWLKDYMAEEYPAAGVGRPALADGQMMYVEPDPMTLQGIARAANAMALVEFLAAHENNPSKAAELAPAALADLKARWSGIAQAKGPGKAPVILNAFNKVFSQYGLSASASKKESTISKLAAKFEKKYGK